MRVTINGGDFTQWLDRIKPLTIARKLNEPSLCKIWVSLPPGGNAGMPARGQALSVEGDDGTLYFTGYVAAAPELEFAGIAQEGPRYRIAIQAISDELLMDQAGIAPTHGAAGMTAGALVMALAAHTGQTALVSQGLTLNTPVSWFAGEPAGNWSKNAAQVVEQARAAYRAVGGAIRLAQIPACVHALNEADGSLDLANLSWTSEVRRLLANDVTVCGEEEPAAYVTEYFVGDGTTTVFELAAVPFALPASKSVLVSELFNGPAIDATVWANSGTSYLSLGSGGLVMKGGGGVDGDAMLSWIDAVEMGGTLLLEAQGVALSGGSAGVLAGFFAGSNTGAGCIAGFAVSAQAGTGTVSLEPMVLGCATGSTYTINVANQYALRIRVHCSEQERMQAEYRSCGDTGAITYGGQTVAAPANLHFEIQEFVNGVAGMPVILYDGAIASLPAACSVVAASSVNLVGTMRGIRLTSLGSGWVVCTPCNGAPFTRRLGTIAEGGECHVASTGKLTFYAGYVPPTGEQIAVSYRAKKRSCGRAVNTGSQRVLAQAGLPAVSAWMGSVTNPPARSSADCRNAAATLAAAAGSTTSLWTGSYSATRFSFAADVWPGDALQVNAPSANMDAQVVVRAVTLTYTASYPDVVGYVIRFANDWAEDLAIKTSTAVPADAWLPVPVAPSHLPNLSGLTVTALNGSSVSVNTGVAAPAGGGFEVRRRDYAFASGQDADLVMRGTQPNLTLARQSANDRFYIRTYDGATPPNYSEFSAAICINLPVGS
jgi:hypothetical protein